MPTAPVFESTLSNTIKNHAHTGVIIYCGGDEGIPSHGTECRLRGNRDDLTALHWSNLLVVEPAICDCDGLVPFRSTGNNKMPRWGIGDEGIRTLDTLAGILHFQCSALDQLCDVSCNRKWYYSSDSAAVSSDSDSGSVTLVNSSAGSSSKAFSNSASISRN